MFPNLTEYAAGAPFCRQRTGRAAPDQQAAPGWFGASPDPCRVGKRTVVLIETSPEHSAQELLSLFRQDEEQIIEMDMLIGPLLERNGGYGYDTFTMADGLRSSFRYLRLDAARYDQRALIAETRRDPRCNVGICETQTEFERAVETARQGDMPTDEGERLYQM